MDFSGRLCAPDDRAAVLTPVTGDSTFRRFHLLELVALTAGRLKTFRTKAVAQFLPSDGQVAVAAAQCLLPFRQQIERRVVAGIHVE